jgi:hypothetical protein
MHAQQADEIQNSSTSSIHNSSIECPINMCETILES